jgi:hypothetical protein
MLMIVGMCLYPPWADVFGRGEHRALTVVLVVTNGRNGASIAKALPPRRDDSDRSTFAAATSSRHTRKH